MRCHTFADDALHPNETHANLVLDQFANGSDATVAEVVNVVGHCCAFVDFDHALDDVDKVALGEGSASEFNVDVDAPVELVSPDISQIVSSRVEEHLRDEALGTIHGGWFARSHSLVELFQRVVFVLSVGIGFPRRPNEITHFGIFVAFGRIAEDFTHRLERVELEG